MGFKAGKTKIMLEDAIVGAYRGSLEVYVVMASGIAVTYATRMCMSICKEQHIRYVLDKEKKTFRVSNGGLVFKVFDKESVSLAHQCIRGTPIGTPVYIDHHVYDMVEQGKLPQ
jgi:hypothetical protein